MVQINWTEQSIDDLNGIFEYIAKDSKMYAKIQVLKIRSQVRVLKNQIYSGKIVDEVQDENVRELIEGNYRIIYYVANSNRIDILLVHHTSRDLSKRKMF